MAGKRFDDHLAEFRRRERVPPAPYLDAVQFLDGLLRPDLGTDAAEAFQIVHPEPDGDAMLAGELAGQWSRLVQALRLTSTLRESTNAVYGDGAGDSCS